MNLLKIAAVSFLLASSSSAAVAKDERTLANQPKREHLPFVRELPEEMARFKFDTGHEFTYPDAVKGVYVTGHSAGGEKFNQLTQLLDHTDLNAMVIDIKDDRGNLTYLPEEGSTYHGIGKPYIKDPAAMLKTLEEKQIYPIARVVVFKDSVLAAMKPEWSFKEGNEIWKNGRNESFVNPYLGEVWDYNVGIAIEAAKLGFQEIQFDYVRFPEGFETRDTSLNYSKGQYETSSSTNIESRISAVTDFVKYAEEKLEPYGVNVSVDIFGYTATLPEAPGIGQNFSRISEHVDVISSMIYPSHWTPYFGVSKPDLQPYEIVSAYTQLEKAKLAELSDPPLSRPWLQDFTATWLGPGNYQVYGKAEIEAQIRALSDNGINEFLLWNSGNKYTGDVDYTP
ncbi:GTP-binding protein [Bacillus canaveralius]|uniref:GTP-binding protein n=1 Tax=Bacillus canaveralius TaxID=1403243 RepID=A0A2N5GKI5_9BACI|nr:putative glycoside hydrolase [Bacillus canaveralius]PLR82035.1 GTP-binding protein [Bacillus canaveralius]PLR99421.1 GTP-binding protein [Bacillus canaveralius]RSK48661.1 GTP-binding protein [Bacillus canaveralius]